MQINRVWETRQQGYPLLHLDIDGREAVLGLDNKLTFLNLYGIVYLGAEFRDIVSVEVEPAPGYNEHYFPGFTDDPEVIRIYREWRAKYSAA